MAQTCRVCRHADLAAIDAALLAGEPLRDIAGRWRLSKSGVERHKAEHLPEPMVRAQEQAEADHGIDLTKQLKAANSLAWEIASNARKVGDGELALKALDRVLRQLTLVAELAEQIDRRPVNVLILPEWLSVRGALVEALDVYPDARLAVAARLVALEAGNGRGN